MRKHLFNSSAFSTTLVYAKRCLVASFNWHCTEPLISSFLPWLLLVQVESSFFLGEAAADPAALVEASDAVMATAAMPTAVLDAPELPPAAGFLASARSF